MWKYKLGQQSCGNSLGQQSCGNKLGQQSCGNNLVETILWKQSCGNNLVETILWKYKLGQQSCGNNLVEICIVYCLSLEENEWRHYMIESLTLITTRMKRQDYRNNWIFSAPTNIPNIITDTNWRDTLVNIIHATTTTSTLTPTTILSSELQSDN